MDDAPTRKTLSATPAMVEAAKKAAEVVKLAQEPQPLPPGAIKPAMRLERKPQVGEVYWCDFSQYNWRPEFDAMHLAVIIRSGGFKNATHMVVPLTKKPQHDNAYGHKLKGNPNPGSADESWAVCDHLYTVCTERLTRLRDHSGARRKPFKIADEDVETIGRLLLASLQVIRQAVFGDKYIELPQARPSGEVSQPVTPGQVEKA